MKKALYSLGLIALGVGAALVVQKAAPVVRHALANGTVPVDQSVAGGKLRAAKAAVEKIVPTAWKKAGELMMEEEEVAGIVLGEKISAFQVEVIARMFLEGGMDNPLERAWESVKQQVYERHFAEDHGLEPTEKEVLQFTQSMRDMIESSGEGKACSNILISATGLSEEQYWNEYRLKHESPAQLIKMRIDQYLADNFMGQLDYANIRGEITNLTLINKFNG